MDIEIDAAVVRSWGGPFAIEKLRLSLPPRAHEVLVRIRAVGICRTDLHMRDAEYRTPMAPFVGGHEGAGVVESVGSAVSTVSPGDHVILSFPSCGACSHCRSGSPAYCESGFPLSFSGHRSDGSTALSDLDGHAVNGHIFQQSSFASHALAHERNLVRIPRASDEELAVLAPLGCGVQTGAGAVLNVIDPRPGSSVLVIGAGTVGLAAVMAAKATLADTIVVVEPNADRRELARELGATHALGAGAFVDSVLDICPRGVDGIVETSGVPQNLTDGLLALAELGVLTLVSSAPLDTSASIDVAALLNGRTLRGVIQGGAVPQNFIPQLIRLRSRGQFPVERLVQTYEFERIHDAVADMESGACIKPVLVMPA